MVRWDDEDTVRMRPPADPWAGHDGLTQEFPAARRQRRQVYGRVYLLITNDPRDGLHPYVGQTTTTIHQRVHGPNGHTSAASIDRDPWKARILAGRDGYRQLKVIYATDNPGADQVRLDMAEAFAIDQLKTTHNDQRPIRTGSSAVAAPRRPVRSSARRAPARHRPPARLFVFLALAAFFTYLSARLVLAMELPWPAAPWIVAPTVGIVLAWQVFWWLHRNTRRLTRHSRR
jgi:hypothetical protein